jgi:sulfur carrier protein ThiS
MRVTILPAREVREMDVRTVGDLLKALGLHRDAHLVVRGEDILTTDVRLTAADEVEVWPVISGGSGGGQGRPLSSAAAGGGGRSPRTGAPDRWRTTAGER